MSFIPVLIMNLMLLVITILLVVADRILVNYGECKITVDKDGEKKEFVVEGGEYLISNLMENNIQISASCGGKATCGYCKVKVLNGGGEILPTEEIFMSREEEREGMRLACQVKVKNNIEIEIPDYLTVVKGIVKNKTYDSKLRWNFIINKKTERLPEGKKAKLSLADQLKIDQILEADKDTRGALIPVLQAIHGAFHYLPELSFQYIAEKLDIPLSIVFRVATFYNAFSLKPRGKFIITICLGTACHVKGAGHIVDAFERELGIKMGQTTSDMLFTLEGVRCIGCCGLAPVLKVNEDVHGLMTRKKVSQLIKQYRGALVA